MTEERAIDVFNWWSHASWICGKTTDTKGAIEMQRPRTYNQQLQGCHPTILMTCVSLPLNTHKTHMHFQSWALLCLTSSLFLGKEKKHAEKHLGGGWRIHVHLTPHPSMCLHFSTSTLLNPSFLCHYPLFYFQFPSSHLVIISGLIKFCCVWH